MSREFDEKTAVELKSLIVQRQVSPVDIVTRSIERMHEVEPVLNNFVTMTEDLAIEAAREAERKLMAGEPLGLLHGLPISIKDLIAVKDVRFTLGSQATESNVATLDAPSVERVKHEGAAIIGKTTTSEFGCKPVGDSPVTGITRNPWNLDKTPGGSSCGAVASVATGVTPFALGTDGGGSVRIPSFFTGLFAIKAQFSRVPIFPTSATPTLAHVGPIGRTVRDVALLLQAIAGFDRRDPFSVAGEVPDFLAACERPIEGMRIAWSPTLGYAEPQAEVVEICARAVRVFEELGCQVDLVETVMDRNPSDLWMAEFYAGVGTQLKDTLQHKAEILDPAVVDVLSGALDQTIEEYYAKVFARYEFREQMRAFMENYDLLATPTLPVPAFDVGLNVPPQLPGANMISWVAYTYPFNLTGAPAASMPVGFTSEGLPIGLQLVSKTNGEEDIFRAAAVFEEARPWADKRPILPQVEAPRS